MRSRRPEITPYWANGGRTGLMDRPAPRLYLITPPQLDVDAFAQTLDATLQAGDVACLQIRLKQADGSPADDQIICKAAETLCPLAHQHNVAVLLNDRPDLARELGCDGVHIGQQDMPYKQARALLGPEAIIGVTCHASRHLAMLAGDAGADYVAFGAFFDTQTKDTTAQATPDILTWWQEVMEPPCVAIGGITPENGAELTMAGADFLAVSSGVWDHRDGPVAAMRAFDEIFARHR